MKKSKIIIIECRHPKVSTDEIVSTNKIPSIDNVDTRTLDVALRACDISVPLSILDKIIDVVELLEYKGDKTTIKDMLKLKQEWKPTNNN
jgi:hypothetical protein